MKIWSMEQIKWLHLYLESLKCATVEPNREDFLTFAPYLTSGSGETPTVDTIDSYMNRLHSIILANPQDNENFIATVREVVNRLDR